jgi:ribosomal protein S12 methylthiotransferase accessory factor YcaO
MLQQGQQPFVNNLEFLRDSTTKKPTHRKFISSVGIWNGLSNLFERDSGQLHL